MKYAQLVIGLLIGTALGGAGVAATGTPTPTGTMDHESIRAIVRETIAQEPQLIMDSVQKYQEGMRNEKTSAANEKLKDPATREAMFNDPNSPFIGPKDAERVVVEFFDYNCPACKMMFEGLDKLAAEDKAVKIIFKEYPIFGEQSETNSKIGIAVHRLDNSKYFDFHKKMMSHKGRADKAAALGFVKEIGLDPDAVMKEAESAEVAAILDAERKLGNTLNIQGTPTLVVNDEVVPHAMSYEDLKARVN